MALATKSSNKLSVSSRFAKSLKALLSNCEVNLSINFDNLSKLSWDNFDKSNDSASVPSKDANKFLASALSKPWFCKVATKSLADVKEPPKALSEFNALLDKINKEILSF